MKVLLLFGVCLCFYKQKVHVDEDSVVQMTEADE